MADLYELLAAPFVPSEIEWRVGSMTGDKKRGMALAYIDARTVMERLDAVCGPAGWQNRYSATDGKTVCEIGVRDPETSEWVWKADGAGNSDVEAEKGALSDAFKRAAVRWGIGRYLYNVGSPWVELTEKGRSHVIADHEHAKLDALVSPKGVARSKPQVVTTTVEPPPQTAPAGSDTKKMAAEWARNAHNIIAKMPNAARLDEWVRKWNANIMGVQELAPDSYATLMAAIAKRKTELANAAPNTLAAG